MGKMATRAMHQAVNRTVCLVFTVILKYFCQLILVVQDALPGKEGTVIPQGIAVLEFDGLVELGWRTFVGYEPGDKGIGRRLVGEGQIGFLDAKSCRQVPDLDEILVVDAGVALEFQAAKRR